jgi:hypothetical protein
MKKIISILVLLQTCFTFAQSKKEQIEILKFRVDSLNTILSYVRNANSQKIQDLESQISSLNSDLIFIKNKLAKNVDSLNTLLAYERNANSQKKQECEKQISLLNAELVLIKNKLEEKKHETDNLTSSLVIAKSFNSLDYDFDQYNGSNFKENYDTVIIKENKRIHSSNYAKRDYSLKIRLFTGETISLVSKSEHDGNEETHFLYLFEDKLRAKLFYVMINYSVPGSGTKRYSLIEMDLNTGNTITIVSNIGSNFYFNKDQTYLIVYGWYDSGDYVKDNQLQIINVLTKKTELALKDVEPINISWVSDYEFQCQLLKYSKEKEWPNSRIPSKVRSGNLNKFKLKDGIWSKQ